MARPDVIGDYVIAMANKRGPRGITKENILGGFAGYLDAIVASGKYLDLTKWKNFTVGKRGVEDALLRKFKQGSLTRRLIYKKVEVLQRPRRDGTRASVEQYCQEYEYFYPGVEPHPPQDGQLAGPLMSWSE